MGHKAHHDVLDKINYKRRNRNCSSVEVTECSEEENRSKKKKNKNHRKIQNK
jgi:hypothetical protein